jgi:hypothetical protein
MIEIFVSFVIFVVNDIRLSNSGHAEETLKTHFLIEDQGKILYF